MCHWAALARAPSFNIPWIMTIARARLSCLLAQASWLVSPRVLPERPELQRLLMGLFAWENLNIITDTCSVPSTVPRARTARALVRYSRSALGTSANCQYRYLISRNLICKKTPGRPRGSGRHSHSGARERPITRQTRRRGPRRGQRGQRRQRKRQR